MTQTALSDSADLRNEEWRPVPDWHGFYEVSDLGRIKSLARAVEVAGDSRRGIHTRKIRDRILRPKVDTDGYLKIDLCRDGTCLQEPVHRLVLLSFVGPHNDGQECCHYDGVPMNNSLSNLRWGTRAENAADRIRHGWHRHGRHGTANYARGERHSGAKLTESDVLAIRASSLRVFELAARYGVAHQTISNIRMRKRWRHV